MTTFEESEDREDAGAPHGEAEGDPRRVPEPDKPADPGVPVPDDPEPLGPGA